MAERRWARESDPSTSCRRRMSLLHPALEASDWRKVSFQHDAPRPHTDFGLVFEQVEPETAPAKQPPGSGGEDDAAAREEGSWHPKAEVPCVTRAPESKKRNTAGGRGRHDQ